MTSLAFALAGSNFSTLQDLSYLYSSNLTLLKLADPCKFLGARFAFNLV